MRLILKPGESLDILRKPIVPELEGPKGPRVIDVMANLALWIATAVALALIVVGMCSCSGLDNYDRSYSLSYSDGKQNVTAGVTLHPNGRTRTGMDGHGLGGFAK
jgi:hypothetical protein